MTFEETQNLTSAIQAIETWTRAYERENNEENPNYDHLVQYRKWVKEAKEKVFAHCTK